MTTILADIGGTHARFGTADASHDGGLANLEKFEVSRFDDLAQALDSYLQLYALKKPATLRLAAAAREVEGGVWRFTHTNSWVIDRAELEKIGWRVEILINDFAASAHGAVALTADQLTTLKTGQPTADLARVILGPGTGLGMAFLFPRDGKWIVQETFGGHMLITTKTDEQFQILKLLPSREEGDTASLVPEDVVSGRGLPMLYQAVCKRDGVQPHFTTTADLLNHADNAQVKTTLRLFHEFLGLFAHNAAVTVHAFGGIYLDGGVIQRLHAAGLYDAESFARFFVPTVSPVVRTALENTPMWLINDPYVALRGLAALHG